MKPIELSDLQKEHLLEMCNKLFISSKPIINKKGFIKLWQQDLSAIEGEYLIKIHWFEFCITILMNKIYYEFYKDMRGNWELLTAETFLIKVIKYDIHPIDYLYEQFLKIK